MKNENEGVELRVIKGIEGISRISVSSYDRDLHTRLLHISDYNNYATKYNIDQINFIYPFGALVFGIKRKNGKEIRLAQRAWRRKI